jgi:hypothetical protein
MQFLHKYPWLYCLFLLLPIYYILTLIIFKTFWKQWIAWAIWVLLPVFILLPLDPWAPWAGSLDNAQILAIMTESRQEFLRYHHFVSYPEAIGELIGLILGYLILFQLIRWICRGFIFAFRNRNLPDGGKSGWPQS